MPAHTLNANVSLRTLLAGIVDAPDIPLAGIASDSRQLEAGDVFLACQGATSHGLDYLRQALAAGVAAVVWDSSTGSEVKADVPMVAVDGLANQLGEIANRWFDYPSRDVRVTGVTGTNGKTTVAYLLQQCRRLLHEKCGYIGTLGSGLGEVSGNDSLTTPACIELHAQLADFRAEGAKFAAVEVSSHAIEQLRIDGVQFDSAVFTNLSRDHIDYHGGMREYFESKASLFVAHDMNHRIVNVDSEFGVELAGRCSGKVVLVSTQPHGAAHTASSDQPYVCVRSFVATPAGFDIAVATSWGSAEFSLSLSAEFNVANAAQVLAVLLSQGVPLEAACGVLGEVVAPPGRMQKVSVGNDRELPAVFVDYSHTPASLEVALQALRGHCEKNLWCVFGCGGDRDRGKRPMMGQVAASLADIAIVSNDNPRSEDPAAIIAEIVAGMHADATVIEDRAAAIAYAIAAADADDTILIAGKGHEDYQIIADSKFHFSDFEVAVTNLEARAHPGVDA